MTLRMSSQIDYSPRRSLNCSTYVYAILCVNAYSSEFIPTAPTPPGRLSACRTLRRTLSARRCGHGSAFDNVYECAADGGWTCKLPAMLSYLRGQVRFARSVHYYYSIRVFRIAYVVLYRFAMFYCW